MRDGWNWGHTNIKLPSLLKVLGLIPHDGQVFYAQIISPLYLSAFWWGESTPTHFSSFLFSDSQLHYQELLLHSYITTSRYSPSAIVLFYMTSSSISTM